MHLNKTWLPQQTRASNWWLPKHWMDIICIATSLMKLCLFFGNEVECSSTNNQIGTATSQTDTESWCLRLEDNTKEIISHSKFPFYSIYIYRYELVTLVFHENPLRYVLSVSHYLWQEVDLFPTFMHVISQRRKEELLVLLVEE